MRLKLINESIDKIDKSRLLTLWYENEKGDKYIPDLKDALHNIPIDKYPYQVSQFPNVLRTTYLKCYDDKSEEVASGESSWSEDLVLAIANTGEYSLSEAILIVVQSCERCMNALAHKYNIGWGYPEHSKEWNKCGTSCEFCKEQKQL